RLARRVDREASEPAAEPLDPGEADPFNDRVVAVQDVDAPVLEDRDQLVRLAALVIVIPEDRDDRDLDPGERADDLPHLVGPALVRQVAAEREDVRAPAEAREELDQFALRGAAGVKVADRGDPDRP